MVKRKYLKFTIFLNLLFIHTKIYGSAWLPEPKKYKIAFSYSHVDYKSEKEQLKRIEYYRQVDQSIDRLLSIEKELYQNKDKIIDQIKQNNHLKEWYKQQQIQMFLLDLDAEILAIKNTIKEKTKILDDLSSYHNLLYAKTTVEYGVSKNLSLGIASSVDNQYFLSSKYTKAEKNSLEADIFVKLKLFQNKKYVISLQPKFYMEKAAGTRDQAFAEISLLTGKTYKSSLGEVFIEGWIGFGKCVSYSCANKHYSHYSVSEGYKMPFGLMITNFTRYYFRKNYGEIYNRTVYNQFSIAKEVNFKMPNHNKITFQLGYFTDQSLSSQFKKYYNISGSVFSIWLDI